MATPNAHPTPSPSPDAKAFRARLVLELHRAQRAGKPVRLTRSSGISITGRVHSATFASVWLLVPPDAEDPGDVLVLLRDVIDLETVNQ